MNFNRKKIGAAILIGMLGFGMAGVSLPAASEAHHRVHRDSWEDCPANEYGHHTQASERMHNPDGRYCR